MLIVHTFIIDWPNRYYPIFHPLFLCVIITRHSPQFCQLEEAQSSESFQLLIVETVIIDRSNLCPISHTLVFARNCHQAKPIVLSNGIDSDFREFSISDCWYISYWPTKSWSPNPFFQVEFPSGINHSSVIGPVVSNHGNLGPCPRLWCGVVTVR